MDDIKESLIELSTNSADQEKNKYVEGPPYSPKDYMVSPSTSDTFTGKESVVSVKRKILPIDLKFKQDALDARKSLKKLQKLIRDKFGRDFVERQGHLVGVVAGGMTCGFLMEDIAPVTEVMEYFILNCKCVPDYVNMINAILKICVKPPRVISISDTMTYKKDLISYFTMFSELLVAFNESGVQLQVVEILENLLVRQEPVDLTCIKLSFCYAAMEDSLLPYTLAALLETAPDRLYTIYLNLSLHICQVSKKSCIAMIENGAMEFILCRLGPHYGTRERGNHLPGEEDESQFEKKGSGYYHILETVGHLMWIFLEITTECNIDKPPSSNALWGLRFAFHAEAKKQTEKGNIIRNNLASIVLKLYAVFGEVLPVIQTGLAVDIAMLAVATEFGTENTWAENICFGTAKEDYLLKEMMMIGCCALAKDENASQILREKKVLEGILVLINADMKKLSVPWSPSQFLTLLTTGLTVLSELVPVLPDVYVANQGNRRVLSALEWFMEEHLDKFPLLETLKTLCCLVSCKNNSTIIEDLKKRNATQTLLNVCFYLVESESFKKSHQEKLMRVFFVLEKLCENERKIDSGCGHLYVKSSINFLTRVTKNHDNDSKLESELLICFSAFLWEAIIWCRTLLKQFTEQNGIYLLLDLIEMSSYPVQVILLGPLVDMTDEGEAITHLLTWRGKDGYGILNTIIKIWKKEEFLHNVPRTENGCISDTERVLMSEEQWYLTHCVKIVGSSSPAIAEMFCNARPKIHSLYQFISKKYGHFTQFNESLYSVSFAAVEPHNQVYIPLIEHFFTLKLGEIWYEIYNEIIVGGLVPTLVDGETLRKLVERKNEWAYRLKVIQEELADFQKANSVGGEDKLYQLIRSCCMTSALDALHELDFIARTTYKDVEVTKKRIQLQEMERSLNIPLDVDDSHIHRTALRDSNVTYLCGKYVWFKSEREVIPENNLVQPVSPKSSSCYKMDV